MLGAALAGPDARAARAAFERALAILRPVGEPAASQIAEAEDRLRALGRR